MASLIGKVTEAYKAKTSSVRTEYKAHKMSRYKHYSIVAQNVFVRKET